jgi:cytochrome c5
MKKNYAFVLMLLSACAIIAIACSKGSDDPPADPCSGITVAVSGTPTNPSTPGGTNGSINASASGGSGFTYSLNNGTFQSSGSFTGLAAGSYTVTAKTAAGCSGTQTFTLISPTPSCSGVNIVVTATATAGGACSASSTGSITASATGSTGLTYSINGTTFQATGSFSNLAAGSYTVTAKDVNGCTGTTTVNIAAPAAGPLFSAVKTLIQNSCQSCHNNSIANGGMNWQVECNIIANKDRIKARAVDNNPSSMPPTGALAQADKDKITAWLNAGGRYTD